MHSTTERLAQFRKPNICITFELSSCSSSAVGISKPCGATLRESQCARLTLLVAAKMMATEI